jgi:hypothetical protein
MPTSSCWTALSPPISLLKFSKRLLGHVDAHWGTAGVGICLNNMHRSADVGAAAHKWSFAVTPLSPLPRGDATSGRDAVRIIPVAAALSAQQPHAACSVLASFSSLPLLFCCVSLCLPRALSAHKAGWRFVVRSIPSPRDMAALIAIAL